MRRDLLSRFERSVVFQVNSNPGRSERMAAHRSGYTNGQCSPADHSVGLGPRHRPSGRLFLVKSLKERLVWLKPRFFQILGHVILSQDKADPTHADRVARLAASLMQEGLTVFLDQNRGDEEEKLAWDIWMENQIEKADYVLVVCTELYLKKSSARGSPRRRTGSVLGGRHHVQLAL